MKIYCDRNVSMLLLLSRNTAEDSSSQPDVVIAREGGNCIHLNSSAGWEIPCGIVKFLLMGGIGQLAK